MEVLFVPFLCLITGGKGASVRFLDLGRSQSRCGSFGRSGSILDVKAQGPSWSEGLRARKEQNTGEAHQKQEACHCGQCAGEALGRVGTAFGDHFAEH